MQEKNRMNKKYMFFIFISLIMTIIIKVFQESILPYKYFLDSNHILCVMNNKCIADSTYTFTANFFNIFNIFNFTTLSQWRYLLTIIFLPMTFFLIGKNKNYDNFDYMFLIASVGLLDIYVFNLSKDIIQFLFFYLIALVLLSKKSNINKLFFISSILLIESLYFRVYYALLAILIVCFYFLYNKIIFGKKINKKSIFKMIAYATILFFVVVFILSCFSSNNYNSIIHARYNVNIGREFDPFAITIVNDPLGYNSNFLIFLGNYIINLFRFLIPIELIVKGPKYVVFAVYQIVILWYLYKSKDNISKSNLLTYITFISYIIVSVIFEPDFGSFIRHESTTFPVLLLIIQSRCISNRLTNKSKKEK